MVSRTTRFVVGSCAVVASLAMTACGSSNDGDSSSSSQSGGATSSGSGAKATKSAIKIGVLAGLTGPLQPQYGANEKIVKAWASSINDAGGLQGHPIEVIAADSKGDPAAYQAGAKKLIETDKVAALISADDYAEAAGAAYIGKSGVPVVGSNGTNNTTWGKLPNYFQVNTSYPYSSGGEIVALKAAGLKSVSAVVCAEVPNCLSSGKVQDAAASGLDMRYDGTLTVAGTAASYQAQCVQITSKKSEAIALSIAAPVAAKLIPQCTQQGFTGTIAYNTQGFVYSQATQTGASSVVADLQGFPWWIDAAPVKNFRDIMKKYAGDVDYRSGNHTNTWQSVKLIEKALGNADLSGDVTPAVLTTGLHKIKDETLNGLLSSPVSYTAGKPAAANKCFWPIQWKKGEDNPKVLSIGQSGNGASGDLSSSCDTVTK